MKNERNVLIVDDEEDIAEGIESLISDLFDKTHIAHSVEKAISQLYQYQYDLIILDINLGGRNGAEIIKFLVNNPSNLNSMCPFIIMSGIINEDFIKANHQRFAGILPKPFDGDDLVSKVKEIIGKRPPEEIISKNDIKEIPIVSVEMPFPVDDIQKNVIKVLAQVRKKSKLRDLLTEIQIDRSSDQYYLQHIGTLINCATAISMKLEWSTDKTLEKFVYAAYLHDMSLKKAPELAKYKTFEEIDENQMELGIERYELALNHSEIAYKVLEKLEDLPPDVANMVRMHHEKPRGNGFPYKADHKKMSPVVSVFIAAHELTEFIHENENWKLADFLNLKKEEYRSPTFIKIYRALEELK